MNTYKTGDFIKSLRKEMNMTQLELAQRLNCTDKAVSRWETGKGLPDADMLLMLSDIFGVSINEILIGERFDFSETSEENISESTDERQKIEEIISCTDETIVDVLKDKENEIVRINRSVIHLISACCIQVLVYFVLPEFVLKFNPLTEPILILIYASVLNFVYAGMIKDKIKWLFPLFVMVSMLAPLVTSTNDAHVYLSVSPIFGIACLGIMAAVSGVKSLIKKFFIR